MEIIIYVITGALVGTFIGWLAADAQSVSALQAEKDAAAQRFSALEKEFAAYREATSTNLETANESLREKSLEIDVLKERFQTLLLNLLASKNKLSAAEADFKGAMLAVEDKNG